MRRMWMGGRRMRGSVGLWGCLCGVRSGEEGGSSIMAGRVELCRTIACGRRAVREWVCGVCWVVVVGVGMGVSVVVCFR